MTPDAVYKRIDQRMVPLASGCVTSTYSRQSGGYCQVGWAIDGVRHMALVHRLVFERVHGPIPAGYDVDHICRVRHCVNIDHLRLLTASQNRQANGHTLKTHCPMGHPYSPDNTHINRHGHRICRACFKRWRP